MKWETYFESVELVNDKYLIRVSYGKDGVTINNESSCDSASDVAQELREMRKAAKVQLQATFNGENNAPF